MSKPSAKQRLIAELEREVAVRRGAMRHMARFELEELRNMGSGSLPRWARQRAKLRGYL